MISLYTNKKDKLNICEDSLTASVFDLLKFLPYDIFWKIITKAQYYDSLPKYCGEILSITFWEKWNSKDTPNSRYVEPDVFIRFEEFDLIVEAKRYDINQQHHGQLNNQIISYLNEFKDENKKLFYIQLGGLYNKEKLFHDNAIVSKTDWTRILNETVKELETLNSISIQSINPYKRILQDLVKTFELHQFYRKSWLNSIYLDSTINYFKEDLSSLFNYAKKQN